MPLRKRKNFKWRDGAAAPLSLDLLCGKRSQLTYFHLLLFDGRVAFVAFTFRK